MYIIAYGNNFFEISTFHIYLYIIYLKVAQNAKKIQTRRHYFFTTKIGNFRNVEVKEHDLLKCKNVAF